MSRGARFTAPGAVLLVLCAPCALAPAASGGQGPAAAAPADALAGPEAEAGAPSMWAGLYPPIPTASPIPADPVRACEAGRCVVMSRDAAVAKGYTLVDLSDDWAPTIFQDGVDADGRRRVNGFRQRFLDLANDRTDHDGDPLEKWETNYLELYGIPPAISLHMKRWRTDRERTCWDDVDFDAIRAFEDKVRFRGLPKAWIERRDRLRRVVRKDPADAKAAADLDEAERRVAVVANVQKRLKCESIGSPFRRIQPGHEDGYTHEAVATFEKRHRIFGYGHIQGDTLAALGQTADEVNHGTLLRVLGERVAAASGVVEDGSAEGSPDLVGEHTRAFAAALGVDTPEGALDWFDRVVSYRGLTVGARLPDPPAYYSDHMDLRIEIDRGDVWYDAPYDGKGRERTFPRSRRPALTLYVRHQDRDIPLVRWNTTIGSWRKEMVQDGYVYLKYKNSDVGPRVMRQIIAGPVWIPPDSTPTAELIKKKRNRQTRRREWVVNYDEMGPGHLSAYGLVAGYLLEHVCRRDGSRCWDRDNQIRIHGSSDYMSILVRYSHGCHRLYNHLAIRLYDFILRHRRHRVVGETALDYEREFEQKPKGEDKALPFKIELLTRGFRYFMDPPLPVEVFEGTIRGEEKEPIEGFVRIKGQDYALDAWVAPEGGDPRPPSDALISAAEAAQADDAATASDPALRAAAAADAAAAAAADRASGEAASSPPR